MPRIHLIDPWATSWRCDTRQAETVLKAWFDEVLPGMTVCSPGGSIIAYPQIEVLPMWAWGRNDRDPDWLLDNRVIFRRYYFPARNGEEGLAELLKLRRLLEREMAALDAV